MLRDHAELFTQSQTGWSIQPPFTMQDLSLLRALADSILAGEPTVELITNRCSRTLGRSWRWLRPLAKRYLSTFENRPRPRHREVVDFLKNDVGLTNARSKYFDQLSVATCMVESQSMQPVAAAASWNIPSIESTADLASWLGVTADELRWFADLKALGYKENAPRLSHYRYRILAKRNGNIRLIEAPKPRLKDLQQQILFWILEKVPPHPAVHGFVKGRSIKTFVAPHAGQGVVLRMDLKDFFPAFAGARVQAFFRTLGYPEPIADFLGGICTNSTPQLIWEEISSDVDAVYLSEARRLYSRPHLPQGAPSSPAIANLCCYRLDCRLTGLAKSAGATYTRYADDLAFSGDKEFERRADRFGVHVAAILLDEGFSVNHRKTRIMRQGVRQQLAGLVANRHINVPRREFDRLKATLTNCVHSGPESQNHGGHSQFRSHLQGRVAFVEMINSTKGKRLRTLFEQIQWPDPGDNRSRL